MIVIQQVRFEYDERKPMKDMCLGLYVAFPNPKSGDKKGALNADARAHSLLKRLYKKGEVWSERQLAEAQGFLEHMVEVLAVEADPDHWSKMVPAYEMARDAVDARGGVALIANPQLMIEVILTARQDFLAAAEESLRIVSAARRLAHDAPPDSPEEMMKL